MVIIIIYIYRSYRECIYKVFDKVLRCIRVIIINIYIFIELTESVYTMTPVYNDEGALRFFFLRKKFKDSRYRRG